jgi:hypothetical protein
MTWLITLWRKFCERLICLHFYLLKPDLKHFCAWIFTIYAMVSRLYFSSISKPTNTEKNYDVDEYLSVSGTKINLGKTPDSIPGDDEA